MFDFLHKYLSLAWTRFIVEYSAVKLAITWGLTFFSMNSRRKTIVFHKMRKLRETVRFLSFFFLNTSVNCPLESTFFMWLHSHYCIESGMLCSALYKRVGVSLSLVFYVAIHPTSVLPVGKSRNGPPQSMPFCPFHPTHTGWKFFLFFSYYFTTSVRIQLWFLFILFCHRPRPFSMHARAYRCTE